jgi:malate dehydrogenase (oxaloacetate-decarboxylating)
MGRRDRRGCGKTRGSPMKKNSIDTVLQLRLEHRPGKLAEVAQAIASERGLLCEIATLRIGDEHTLREVTVETDTEEQAALVVAAVQRVPGVDVMSTRDRVLDAHRGGKLTIASRVPLETVRDLRTAYTPGVARVVTAIQEDPAKAWDLTWRGQVIGIFSNGSRVLGLGDVGPLASLPVMEGKALLYHRLVGLPAVPIVLDADKPADFIDVVARCSVGFGGIHLEDIRSPDCFEIEDALIARLGKPVFHDDQHGTATAVIAALITASRITGRDLASCRVGQIGLGAAGSAIVRLTLALGVQEVIAADASPAAQERARRLGARIVDFDTLMKEADVVIAATGRPKLIDPKRVRPGQIVLGLSNPDPEIDPVEARLAGAALASDGRTINNALAFPGLFKGALDVRSRSITVEMMIAAARAIASLAPDGELVPPPLDPAVHAAVAKAVADTARAQGLANTATP